MPDPNVVEDQLTPSLGEAQPGEGSPSATAEADFSAAVERLRGSGFTPQEAQEAAESLARLRTEDGQREFRASLYSQALDMLGQELSTVEGVQKFQAILQQKMDALGVSSPRKSGIEEDLLSVSDEKPENTEVRQLKAKVAELEQMSTRAHAIAEDSQANSIRAAAFRDWKSENRDIPPQVILKLSKRFVDDVRRNPGTLRDSASVRQYFNRELSDYREVSQAFSAAPKPKPVPNGGPAFTPSQTEKYSKITDPEKRLDAMIEDIATDIGNRSR